MGSIASGDASSSSSGQTNPSEEDNPETNKADPSEARNGNEKKGDISRTLDNHVDKLDAMLESADNAYHSMSYQNKQMKKYL